MNAFRSLGFGSGVGECDSWRDGFVKKMKRSDRINAKSVFLIIFSWFRGLMRVSSKCLVWLRLKVECVIEGWMIRLA